MSDNDKAFILNEILGELKPELPEISTNSTRLLEGANDE